MRRVRSSGRRARDFTTTTAVSTTSRRGFRQRVGMAVSGAAVVTVLGSLEEVVAVVPAAASVPPTRTIVGIAGSPGAGKTTVGEQLVERLGSAAQLVSMDGFHLPGARLVELGRRDRMGAPDTFDIDGFVALLDKLRFSGDSVTAPAFDRETEEATPGGVVISPEKRIIVVLDRTRPTHALSRRPRPTPIT